MQATQYPVGRPRLAVLEKMNVSNLFYKLLKVVAFKEISSIILKEVRLDEDHIGYVGRDKAGHEKVSSTNF